VKIVCWPFVNHLNCKQAVSYVTYYLLVLKLELILAYTHTHDTHTHTHTHTHTIQTQVSVDSSQDSVRVVFPETDPLVVTDDVKFIFYCSTVSEGY